MGGAVPGAAVRVGLAVVCVGLAVVCALVGLDRPAALAGRPCVDGGSCVGGAPDGLDGRVLEGLRAGGSSGGDVRDGAGRGGPTSLAPVGPGASGPPERPAGPGALAGRGGAAGRGGFSGGAGGRAESASVLTRSPSHV